MNTWMILLPLLLRRHLLPLCALNEVIVTEVERCSCLY